MNLASWRGWVNDHIAVTIAGIIGGSTGIPHHAGTGGFGNRAACGHGITLRIYICCCHKTNKEQYNTQTMFHFYNTLMLPVSLRCCPDLVRK